MSYTKTTWVNDSEPALDQDNLNKIEQGIYDAHVTADGAVQKATFDANTILKADTDNTPIALSIAEQRLLGRLTGAGIAALTATEVRTLLDVSQTGDVVLKSLFDAYTILYADTDNTPAALAVAASRIVGRASTGGIAALTGAEARAILEVSPTTDVVLKSLFDANSILYATTDDIPVALTVGASTVVGRKATGDIVALSASEARTVLDVSATADIVLKSLYDAYSILYADTDNTPAALAIAASRIVGRAASGGIAALTAADVKTLLAIDHGADVIGLGDDDHTQYFLASCYRALTGTAILRDADDSLLALCGGTGTVCGRVVGYGKHHATYPGSIHFTVPNAVKTSKVVAGYFEGVSNTPYLALAYGARIDHITEMNDAHGVEIDGLTIKDAGFALGSDADGDMYQRASGALARLAKGTAYQRLRMKSDASSQEWADEITTLTFIIDGGGNAITTGEKGHLEVPFACTILQATMLADQSGSIVVDIWKDSYANYPPTDADSITASAPPTISSAVKSQDATLTDWTTAVTAGDILAFNVDSCSTITRVTVSLKVKKA